MSLSCINALASTVCHSQLSWIHLSNYHVGTVSPPLPKFCHFNEGTHQESVLCLHHYRIHLFHANEGQLALYSGVFHNTKPVMEPRQEQKSETVICFIWFSLNWQNWIPKKTRSAHSIYRPIGPEAFEYIWKHGAHLTWVTSDESSLETFFPSVKTNNLSTAQLQMFSNHI